MKSMKPGLMWIVLLGWQAASANAQGWHSQIVPPSASSSSPAAASAKARPAAPQPVAAKPQPGQAVGQQLPAQPLQTQIQYLVRTTLMALNDANRTGNYTVLRDLAAPSFRDRNSAADLAQIFAEMRRARLDLSMVALLTPQLDEQPALDSDRRLRLKGSYPTEPHRIVFDLVFEPVGGHWQLGGISIATRPARTASEGVVPGR
jgi:hypothetical protein